MDIQVPLLVIDRRVSHITGIRKFAICRVFSVCWLMAKNLFAVSYQKIDGKDLTDGKEVLCHESLLCRQLADSKDGPS